MKIRWFCLFMCLLFACCVAFAEEASQSQPASVNDLELVKSMSKNLSVKPEQAAGGAGAIFNYAKGKLSKEDFAKVSNAVPGMDSLLKAAPVANSSAMPGQMPSMVSGIATLAGPFKQLGMSPDMVGKFVPEILNFTQQKGGDATKDILSGVLK